MTNQSPKISVIVPVYNVEKYLSRCIDSILEQTFKDFELLLIDDGSKDSSGKICDEYAKKDKHIRVFHKENGGVSSARNLGLNLAVGEWVSFVDADDKIDEKYLYELYENSFNVDFVICGYRQIGIINKTVIYNEAIFNMHSYNDQSYFNKSEIESSCLFYCPWRKLFKMEFIQDNNIRFDEGMFLGEDTCFIISYVKYINNIKVIGTSNYIYSLLSAHNKYLMDFSSFENHIKLFDFYLSSLEICRDFQYYKIREMMYGVYLNKYISYLLTLKLNLFISEIKKYRQTDLFIKIKSCLFPNYNLRRKLIYYLTFMFPFIRFYFNKIIQNKRM